MGRHPADVDPAPAGCGSMDLRGRTVQVLLQARKLPPGAERNELRQLAYALRWLATHPLSPERERKLRRMLGDAKEGARSPDAA